MMTHTDTIQTARTFLSLNAATLPSAQWHMPYAAPSDPWRALRALATGDIDQVAVVCGTSLRLRANADGWREGVILDIPAASPAFAAALLS